MSRTRAYRRIAAALAALVAAGAFAVTGTAQPSAAAGPDLNGAAFWLSPIVTGLAQPLGLAWRYNDNRIYVALQGGSIVIVDPNSNAVVGTALTLTGVACCGERGLLGLAFSSDGTKLYVDYTDAAGTIQIVEYTMNGDVATPSSARPLLSIPHPITNHNGGQLVIGPDDMLYIGVGDGGGAGDQDGNGQNLDVLLGKILRIDPTPSETLPYTIPADNPFVGVANARPEIWMYGLRNPWRFSFDSVTGDMWIGDVGQNAYEEVDFAAAGTSGTNWGWNAREGLHSYNGGVQPPNGTDPLIEQSHASGWCSIIGGFVYRGSAIAKLSGAYVYTDLCRLTTTGAVRSGGAITQTRDFPVGLKNISSFGEDHSGELYVVNVWGTLSKLVPEPPPTISLGGKAIMEGDTGSRAMTFPVSLSKPATTNVTVHYAVTAIDAQGGTKRGGGNDFKLMAGDLTFAVNRYGKTPIVKTISVPVFPDTTAGEGNERFQVTLSSPQGGGYTLDKSVSTATIIDDDGLAPGVTVGVGDAAILQQGIGTQNVTVPITLSAPAAGTTVNYTVTPGSALYSAKAIGGGEFGGKLSGTLTFTNSMVLRNLSFPVWPDLSPDADHTFTVTLTSASGSVTRVRSNGTVTLINP